jgi:hypothetical protein
MIVETASLTETEQWCKWVYSIPHNGTTNINPLRGGDCNQKQDDPNLFCLAGTDEYYAGSGGALQRSVKVSNGKSCLFPLMLCMYSTAEFPTKGVNQLLSDAKDENKSVYELKLNIDGVAEPNLNQHLVESDKDFVINFPVNNVIGKPPQESHGVVAGFMVKVTPEEKDIGRTHTIEFGGKCGKCGYTTDVTYTVSI